MHTIELPAAASEAPADRINCLYRYCCQPTGVLHAVSSSAVRCFDAALARILRHLAGHLEEPAAELLHQQLRKLRWDFLADCGSPAQFFSAREQVLAFLRAVGSHVGLSNTWIDSVDEAVIGLEEKANPLTTSVRELINDPMWEIEVDKLVVIPFGRFESVAVRRKHETSIAFASAGMAHLQVKTLHEARAEVCCPEQAVFLGSPMAFGQAVVTCPLSAVSHFVFYDFISVDYEHGGWPHSFSGFVSDLPDPHRMSFERIRHGDEEPGIDAPTRPDLDVTTHVAQERDVYPRLRFKETVQRIRDFASDLDQSEACTCVLLEDDLWAALPGNAKRFRRTDDDWVGESIDPDYLEPADLILLLQTEPSNLASKTSDGLPPEAREGLALWHKLQTHIRNQIKARGWNVVSRKLIEGGIPSPYQYWFDEGRLGPHNEGVFRLLCELCGMGSIQVLNALSAIAAWHSFRIQAGFQISEQFDKEAKGVLKQMDARDEPIEQDHRAVITLSLADPDLGRYGLCKVVGVLGNDSIPGPRCRRILDPRGVPWRG